MMHRRTALALLASLAGSFAAIASGQTAPTAPATKPASPTAPAVPAATPPATPPARALTPVRVQLNWVPEPEFGGIYAAQQEGFFAKEGLQVEIVKGAAGTPVPQMVAGGKVEFGVVSGDQILSLRERGGELVGLFAIFHTSPMGVMVRADAPYRSLEDLWKSDATVAMETGLPYLRFLKEKFGAGKVKIVPTGTGLAAFERGAVQGQQCFVTAEPVQMELKKTPVRVFSLAESGYDPYTVTVATDAKYLAKNRATCAAFVRALRAGWDAYLREPAKYNPAIAALNPAMSLEAMNLAAAKQRDLIAPPPGGATQVGAMERERWLRLAQQLLALGTIKAAPPTIDDCFWNAPADR
ncbi:MAG: ABC transporter substrate-binding protein [Phycisphaerales bacterium]